MTFPVNPSRSWILLIVLQILLTLPFVPSFRPPPLARVVPPQSIFAVYRQILFGLSEILIPSLVLDDVIFKRYHKALITRLCNPQILSLSDYSSVSFSDLMTIVSSYFGINTGSAESEAASATQSIVNILFALWICRVLHYTMLFGNLLLSQILIISLWILLPLPLVLSFPLLTLIVTLR